ncbi:hypothetical protein Tco_0431305, partial [Tanacetum coccineum]
MVGWRWWGGDGGVRRRLVIGRWHGDDDEVMVMKVMRCDEGGGARRWGWM